MEKEQVGPISTTNLVASLQETLGSQETSKTWNLSLTTGIRGEPIDLTTYWTQDKPSDDDVDIFMREVYTIGEHPILRKPVQEYLDNLAEVMAVDPDTEPAKKRYKFVKEIYEILKCLANYFFGPGFKTLSNGRLHDIISLYLKSFGCTEPETLAKNWNTALAGKLENAPDKDLMKDVDVESLKTSFREAYQDHDKKNDNLT